jgi:hypothetical protein
VSAALAGLGALALALVVSRLAGAFEQLQSVAGVTPGRTLYVPADGASAPAPDEAAPAMTETTDVAGRAASVEPPPEPSTEAPAASGDEHILRALAANPEFARAAEGLLNDADPQTRDEARQLLRDLGVQAPEAAP